MPPTNFGFEHIQSGLYHINDDLAAYGDRLMQFTGLKDKNGTEIYEGDVVAITTPRSGMLGVVKYDEGGFFAVKENGVEEFLYYIKDIEVAGNIYENPELLNNSGKQSNSLR